MPFWLFAVDTHKGPTQEKDFMSNPRLLPAIPTPPPPSPRGIYIDGCKTNSHTQASNFGENVV